MSEIARMIEETKADREFHRRQWLAGVRGASIEVCACNIRLKALSDCIRALGGKYD